VAATANGLFDKATLVVASITVNARNKPVIVLFVDFGFSNVFTGFFWYKNGTWQIKAFAKTIKKGIVMDSSLFRSS
jgi:hypothetical protein